MTAWTVLYNGWPLAYRPNSPSALHLLTLLAYRPPEVEAVVALPAEPFHSLPVGVADLIVSTPNTDFVHLRWEQRVLPNLARDLGVDLVHLTSGGAALLGPSLNVISPADFIRTQTIADEAGRRVGLAARLRDALAQGGLSRARGVFWPTDLPTPDLDAPLHRLSPVVHPAFTSRGNQVDQSERNLSESLSREWVHLDLPETYVLYHGPTALGDLERLLDAWSWAVGSTGENYPLLLIGLDDVARDGLTSMQRRYQLGETLRSLPLLSIGALAALYQGCSALFHPAMISPWSGPLRLALACGKPIVALESPLSDALVGAGAYLVSSGVTSSRALGAALITVVVEESVAATLSHAASQRAASWDAADFTRDLLAAYRLLLS